MRPLCRPVVLFSLRVPLLCVLAVASLAPLGAFSFSPFRGMLEGLFDVTGWGALWTSLAAWLAATACWICASITLNYGPRRFPGFGRRAAAESLDGNAFHPYPGLAAVMAVAPLSVLSGVVAVSSDLWAVLGGSLAGSFAFALSWMPQQSLDAPLRVAGSPMLRLLPIDSAGYREPSTGRLLVGHLFAAQFAALFVALYATVGLLKYAALRAGFEGGGLPPSLAYLLLLIGLLALVFGGLAFYCDRYRIPVLLPWVALLAAASLAPSSDHFVETVRLPSAPRLASPPALLRETRVPVLVCASGGGIEAAAWTAAVLTGLDRLTGGGFAPALKLFSGASGGSVGGMHFVAAYGSEGRVHPSRLDAVFAAAARSSLDAVAWGLVGPDLVRAAVPMAGAWLGPVGRGWALEQAWDPGGRLRAPLSKWRPRLPAVVFNATHVESGVGVALGNVDLRPLLGGFEYRFMNRRQFYDLPLVAAARLSASFPYVTPAPRVAGRDFHFADGGYYDNYGVGAAVAFLTRAYTASAPATNELKLPGKVLLIEIRASRPLPGKAGSSPLLFQWLAPLTTLLNVRDAAQRDRNDTTLDLLSRTLAARGVHLHRVVFEAPRAEVPLSWHLTAAQVEAVRRDWREGFENSPETAEVVRLLTQR